MLRKLMWTGLLGLATAVPLALPATANADYFHHSRFHSCYYVESRARPCDPWQVNGPYARRSYARAFAHDLACRGLQTRVIYR
jgi:hypothetical protein